MAQDKPTLRILGGQKPFETNYIQEYQKEKMRQEQAPPVEQESPYAIAARQQYEARLAEATKPAWQRILENLFTPKSERAGGLLTPNIPEYVPPSELVAAAEKAASRTTLAPGELIPGPTGIPFQEPEQPKPTDWLAQAQALQSQFTPNYADIMARYSAEGEATNAAIQALYSKLAEGAQQNIQQIQDIYGGAEGATGQAYDIGTGNIGEAYSSAQQQAADQLARLGIEAAAPQVINPMALSQAETQSALESGRASALGGIASRGATAQDFASQMAQAAQMQGAEYQTSVTDALRRQLIGLELQAQQDAYQRALQAPGLARDLYEASQLGQPQGLSFEQQLELDRFAFEQAQAAAEIQQQLDRRSGDRYATLFEQLGDAEKALQQLEYERAQGLI